MTATPVLISIHRRTVDAVFLIMINDLLTYPVLPRLKFKSLRRNS